MLLEILIGLLDDGGSQLAPLEPVNRRKERRALRCKFLGAVGAAARVNDGGHVVGPEVSLDELARRADNNLRSQRAHVEVIEHDDI